MQVDKAMENKYEVSDKSLFISADRNSQDYVGQYSTMGWVVGEKQATARSIR
jgi:hypothetical protein